MIALSLLASLIYPREKKIIVFAVHSFTYNMNYAMKSFTTYVLKHEMQWTLNTSEKINDFNHCHKNWIRITTRQLAAHCDSTKYSCGVF